MKGRREEKEMGVRREVEKGVGEVEDRDFFFSSRRRHTRSLCDWSSDVCSSDLFSLSSVAG